MRTVSWNYTPKPTGRPVRYVYDEGRNDLERIRSVVKEWLSTKDEDLRPRVGGFVQQDDLVWVLRLDFPVDVGPNTCFEFATELDTLLSKP